MCVPCAGSDCGNQKRVTDALKMELQMEESSHVGAGKRNAIP